MFTFCKGTYKHTHRLCLVRLSQRAAYLIGGRQLQVAEDGQKDVPGYQARDGQCDEYEGILSAIDINLRGGAQQRDARNKAKVGVEKINNKNQDNTRYSP